MNKQSFNLFSGLILTIFLMFTFSCSQMIIRSSPSMYQENPVRRIAVFGSGAVQWPFRTEGSYLGLTESKQALDILMLQTENVLKSKGYQIVTCKPAGVGYTPKLMRSPVSIRNIWGIKLEKAGYTAKLEKWLVYESPDPNYNKLDESIEWEESTYPPEPLFSLHPNTYDPNVAKAIDEIFTEMEEALVENKLFKYYRPSTKKIAIIQKHLKVDAFLFLRVGGNLYSAGRKAGDAIANMGKLLVATLGHVNPNEKFIDSEDIIVPHCLFVDAKNNDVLWQRGIKFNAEPKTLAPNTMEKALELFPKAGQQMDVRFKPETSVVYEDTDKEVTEKNITFKTAGLELRKGIEKKEEVSYKLGDRGPSGGWIFYDKGYYSDGWRYLEAAPEDLDTKVLWGCYGTGIHGAVGTDIGEGKSDTQAIVNGCKEINIAARKCTEYRGGGKSDWFLPSKEELDQIYTNLKKNGVGGFADKSPYYWSSSDYDFYMTWAQSFASGLQYFDYKNKPYYVRAVRAF